MYTTPDILDIGPVNVRGAIRARSSRVLWTAGTLYVVSRNGAGFTLQTLLTDEPAAPPNHRGYWRAQSEEEGQVSFTRHGCPTCGGVYSALRAIPRESIFSGDV